VAVPPANDDVIYARRAVSGRAWAVPFVLLLALVVFVVVKDLPDPSAGAALAVVGASSPVLAVWLLTLWSINRYAAVTLTRDTLRVGRHTVPVAELDPVWIRMLATKAAPSLRERVVASAATFEVPGHETSNTDRGRLLGGSYAATLGADLVTLRLLDGTRVSVQTSDRTGLLAGLLTAVDG
jgi:hypothetical protein